MKTRAQQGSTLSLVIACTIVIALLGIAFIFMGFIFGGHREAQHAADAGSLNVAKKAIMTPSVSTTKLSGDVGNALAGVLTSPTMNLGQGINLLNFNRLVAQAMLVAMNAEADGSQEGLDNAKEVWKAVEGASDSVGGELRKLLEEKGGPWAAQHYGDVSGNVLRLLGNQGAPTYEPLDFAVAWMNQRDGDFNAANIDLSAMDSDNAAYDSSGMPIKSSSFDDLTNDTVSYQSLPGEAFHKKGSTSYMAGYKPVVVAGLPFYAIPNNPGMQPHLESNTIFPVQMTQPGEGTVWLPPNAFRIGATTTIEIARDPFMQAAYAKQTHKAHVVCVSIIGTPSEPFAPQIPNGYVVIDNSGEADAGHFTGSLPNTDTVAAHELGTGIVVDPTTKFFSFGDGPAGPDNNNKPGNLVDRWQAFNHVTNEDPGVGAPPFEDKEGKGGLYTAEGKPVKDAKEASKIPFVPTQSSTNAAVLCTDNNSAIGGNENCAFLNSANSSGLSPFDAAYHPDSLSHNGGQVSTSAVTASEMSQCKVIDLYGSTPHGGGPLEPYNYSYGPTGIRKYPNGIPSTANQYAWQGSPGFGQAPDESIAAGLTINKSSANNPCQVTEDGSLLEILDMIKTDPNDSTSKKGENFKKKLTDFLLNRAKQMEPKAKLDTVRTLLQNTPIPLGKKMYMYAKNGSIVIDETGPGIIGSVTERGKKADGKTQTYEINYSILEGMSNPYFAYGIHDRLFTTWGDNENADNFQGDIVGKNTVSFTPASGAFGLLGIVNLREESSVNGSLGFNNRD